MLKISLKAYAILFLLLMITFVVIAFQLIPQRTENPAMMGDLVEETVKGARARRFDKNGNLIQDVSVGSWVKRKGQAVTDMEKPHVRVYRDDGSLWDIYSDKGQGFHVHLNGHMEKVHLSENVVVERRDPKEQSWLKLNTQTLLFFPNQSSAVTDDQVFVFGDGMKITAQGMRADIKSNAVEFLKDVHCQYDISKV